MVNWCFGFVVWIPIACYRYSGNPQPTTRTTNLPLVEDEDPDILMILISWGCCNGGIHCCPWAGQLVMDRMPLGNLACKQLDHA